jgi:hypothetical protein
MKAFVTVQDFGNDAAVARLAEWIRDLTPIPVSLNQPGTLLLVCDLDQLGALFLALASSPSTDWVEYTVQFG